MTRTTARKLRVSSLQELPGQAVLPCQLHHQRSATSILAGFKPKWFVYGKLETSWRHGASQLEYTALFLSHLNILQSEVEIAVREHALSREQSASPSCGSRTNSEVIPVSAIASERLASLRERLDETRVELAATRVAHVEALGRLQEATGAAECLRERVQGLESVCRVLKGELDGEVGRRDLAVAEARLTAEVVVDVVRSSWEKVSILALHIFAV
jgi:hypothetical protein